MSGTRRFSIKLPTLTRRDRAIADTRGKRLTLSIVMLGLFIGALITQSFVAIVGQALGPAENIVYQLVVAACYVCLYVVLAYYLDNASHEPIRFFWRSIVVAVIAGGLAGIGLLLTDGDPLRIPYGFDPAFGIPTSIDAVVQGHLTGFLMATIGFVVFINVRCLVLFRRTKSSLRNWYIMITLMVIASMMTIIAEPAGGEPVWTLVPFALAIVVMPLNAFRLSWIAFLSFREKVMVIGLSAALIAILLVLLLMPETGISLDSAEFPYLRGYSFPLTRFVQLCVIFGLIYSSTTLLSLVFHLPTTGDYIKKAGELQALHSVTRLTGQVLDPEKLHATIAASPVEAGAATSAWLALTDTQSRSLTPRLVSSHNIDPAQIDALIDAKKLYSDAVQQEGPIVLNQATTDHRVKARPGESMESLLVVPLVARGRSLGVLAVSKDVSQGFQKDDVETILTFADQAALALENAGLFQEQVESERVSRELSIARDVQQKLLPQAIPQPNGMEIAATSTSALEVGGDYFDFAEIDAQRLGIFVGDVSGKGTSAAFYMAGMKGIFQSLSRLTASPSEFLTNANEALLRSLEKNTFISAIYGVLDLSRDEFLLARAGHCPAALVRANGEARFLRSQGLGLGLTKGALFQNVLREERVALLPGDVLVLYTDGVVEGRSPEGEEYGYEKLLELIAKHQEETPQEIHDAILDDVRDFSQSASYEDDLTLVVFKWVGRHSENVRNPEPPDLD